MAGNQLRAGAANDIEGSDVDTLSTFNLIGIGGSGGLTATNGNLIDVDWTTVLENDGTNPIVKNNGGPTETIGPAARLPGHRCG